MESSNQAKSILLTPTDIDRLTDRIKELEDKLADALLADVRRLVEAAEMSIAPVPLEYVSFNNRISDIELTRKRVEALQQAIAAVERHLLKE